MAVQFKDLKVKQKAMVRGGFGGQTPEEVTIIGVHADVKNGRAGIDYVTANGAQHWAYIAQIDSIVVKPLSYQQQEIERVINASGEDDSIISVCFSSCNVKSKWLNITEKQAKKIQKILAE
jgi:hypothetical protein